MNRPQLICVGLACLDYRFRVDAFPPRERRAPVAGYHEALGGPAAVAAQAIARLGGSATLCARRGDDPSGRKLAEILTCSGVDVSLFKVVAEAGTPVCAVFIKPDGERYLFPYWADLPESMEWVPRSAITQADAVLADSRWFVGATAAARAARESGKLVIVDLDRDTPEAWALTALATHVVADEDVARRVGGVNSLLDRVGKAGAWAAVTLGAGGVAYRGKRLPAFRVDVRDSTGAGDVFHGAFALALAEGATEADALRFATAAGALRCRLNEPPHRDQVDSLLSEEQRHSGSGRDAVPRNRGIGRGRQGKLT